MAINEEKLAGLLDLLRLRLLQYDDLTDQLKKLYTDINKECGNLVKAPLEQKTKAKVGWGPDPNFVKPTATMESQTISAHTLSKDW